MTETDNELLTVKEAAAVLRVGVSTFYTIQWFRPRLVHVTKRAVRVRRGDLNLYIHLRGEAA